MSATPMNDWSVPATMTVAAASEAAATTAVTTALTDIKSALVALANGTEFSVALNDEITQDGSDTDVPGSYGFIYPDGFDGVFTLQGQLLVSTVSEAQAQQNAEAALAAITTAISGLSPATTVTLESTPDGYVFNLLQ